MTDVAWNVLPAITVPHAYAILPSEGFCQGVPPIIMIESLCERVRSLSNDFKSVPRKRNERMCKHVGICCIQVVVEMKWKVLQVLEGEGAE